jgi:hypothetical protein
MKEALDNPEGHFPNAASYKFYDAKKVMGWVFECFFDICLGYGRPSTYDTELANIMWDDGVTPSGADWSILPWVNNVLGPSDYVGKMNDLTDRDLDFLCQKFLDIVMVYSPMLVIGTREGEDTYADIYAPQYWPNKVCFNMKNIVNNTLPGSRRYYHIVMSNSHPLIMNLVFSEMEHYFGKVKDDVVSDTALTAIFDIALMKLHDSLKIYNDDYFMSNLVKQALHVAKDDGFVRVADNKDDNIAKEIASIVVSSQTALMTTLTKAISGQGKEITLHSNVISQEGYDDNFVCYVNESSSPKSFPVHLESMDSVEVWFKNGKNNIIDLNDPDNKVKFRVELLLETVD